MRETLLEIDALRKAGIIGQSAIGGAMGATFYPEPATTFDLDIFVVFEGSPLIPTLTPIHKFLHARGHEPQADGILIHGWPVRFLPAESPLLREAVLEAVEIDYEGAPARVMTAEHLMAIALQTGRAKDFARLVAFVASGVADKARLKQILDRHDLAANWRRFERQHLENP